MLATNTGYKCWPVLQEKMLALLLTLPFCRKRFPLCGIVLGDQRNVLYKFQLDYYYPFCRKIDAECSILGEVEALNAAQMENPQGKKGPGYIYTYFSV